VQHPVDESKEKHGVQTVCEWGEMSYAWYNPIGYLPEMPSMPWSAAPDGWSEALLQKYPQAILSAAQDHPVAAAAAATAAALGAGYGAYKWGKRRGRAERLPMERAKHQIGVYTIQPIGKNEYRLTLDDDRRTVVERAVELPDSTAVTDRIKRGQKVYTAAMDNGNVRVFADT
jgi:hypothetical protein